MYIVHFIVICLWHTSEWHGTCSLAAPCQKVVGKKKFKSQTKCFDSRVFTNNREKKWQRQITIRCKMGTQDLRLLFRIQRTVTMMWSRLQFEIDREVFDVDNMYKQFFLVAFIEIDWSIRWHAIFTITPNQCEPNRLPLLTIQKIVQNIYWLFRSFRFCLKKKNKFNFLLHCILYTIYSLSLGEALAFHFLSQANENCAMNTVHIFVCLCARACSNSSDLQQFSVITIG